MAIVVVATQIDGFSRFLGKHVTLIRMVFWTLLLFLSSSKASAIGVF